MFIKMVRYVEDGIVGHARDEVMGHVSREMIGQSISPLDKTDRSIDYIHDASNNHILNPDDKLKPFDTV